MNDNDMIIFLHNLARNAIGETADALRKAADRLSELVEREKENAYRN